MLLQFAQHPGLPGGLLRQRRYIRRIELFPEGNAHFRFYPNFRLFQHILYTNQPCLFHRTQHVPEMSLPHPSLEADECPFFPLVQEPKYVFLEVCQGTFIGNLLFNTVHEEAASPNETGR